MTMKRDLIVAFCVVCAAMSSTTCAQIVGLDHEYVEASGAGGAGGAAACEPSSQEPCYSGAMGTMGVGACKAGLRTCQPDGSGFGPCLGEVTPAAEDCSSPADEDCTGAVNDSCPCTPGDTEACYGGPMGTEGVGLCAAGTHTCNENGIGFGSCMGEIVPAAESCATPEDEDCDGAAFDPLDAGCACVPNMMTSCSTGLFGVCAVGVMTCSADGNDLGSCIQTVQVSFDDCTTIMDEDCDGVAPGCTGGTVNGLGDGDGEADVNYAVAVDSSQNMITGGVADGVVNGYFVTTGSLALTKHDPNGAVIWTKAVSPGFINHAVVRNIATDANDNIVVTGELRGSFDLGGGMLSSTGTNNSDVLVAKFDSGGNHLWSKRFGDNNYQSGYALALDSSGNIYVTGPFQGSMILGAINLNSQGGRDAFVVKLDPQGAVQWAKRAGDNQDQTGIAIAVTPDDNVVVGGAFEANISFGTTLTSAGGEDIFLVKLSRDDGNQMWAKRFGGALIQTIYDLAADPQGGLALTGPFRGVLNLGGADLTNADAANNTSDIYVAKLLGADGSHIWSQRFGNANEQNPESVTMDAVGNVSITGFFTGSIDFGGGDLSNVGGGTDIFVAKFAGAAPGTHLWSRRFGDANDQRGWTIAANGAGNVIFGGGFETMTDFGAPVGTLTSQGGYDAFVVKLAP